MYKCQIEKRLPEQKPISEPKPKFQRPAKITPNPMLYACAYFATIFFTIFECRSKTFCVRPNTET